MSLNFARVPLFLLMGLTLTPSVHGARILFYFAGTTYSHQISVWPLVEALAASGHNVTFLSSHKSRSPNPRVTEVTPEALRAANIFNGEVNLIEPRYAGKEPSIWDMLPFAGLQVCQILMEDPVTMEWIRSATFDLLIIDNLFNECAVGLSWAFRAKHIIFGTTTMLPWSSDLHGVPAESSWIPDPQYHYPEAMSFPERVLNTLRPISWHLYRKFYYLPRMEAILREGLEAPEMPGLREIEKNASLVFTSAHYSVEYGRSLPPLVVSIGGMHCTNETKPLPSEMVAFIEGSPNGFIYVSFGSGVQFKHMKESLRQTIVDALGSTNTRFLLKADESAPKNMPTNVFVSSWLPQQDILAHPKIRAAVMHGGILGIHEAVYHAVPIILLPVFAEQDYNAERVHNGGHGIRLEITTLTSGILKGALDQILHNPRYKEKMVQVSKVFHDRFMGVKPLDTAVWWTEFVLRHNDTAFLKPLGIDQAWYVRRLLDVWAFLFAVLTLGLFLVWKLVCKCVFRGGKKRKDKQKKN